MPMRSLIPGGKSLDEARVPGLEYAQRGNGSLRKAWRLDSTPFPRHKRGRTPAAWRRSEP
jgi:hypothetical protein